MASKVKKKVNIEVSPTQITTMKVYWHMRTIKTKTDVY
jgi:hypothetical protein